MKWELFINELGKNEEPLTYVETDVDKHILDILKNLPVRYRNVFLLKYSSNLLNNDEIASLLKITGSILRQRLARGKAIIQETIDSLSKGYAGSKRETCTQREGMTSIKSIGSLPRKKTLINECI